jgi:hypothetical protein
MAQFSSYPRVPGATVGQKIMDQSAPVVIASDQSAIHTIVDSSALPAGASTEAKQDAGNASLVSIDGKVATEAKQDTGNTSIASVDAKMSTLLAQTDGVEVSLSSIDTKVATATGQTTGNTSLASIDTKITVCNTGAVTVSASALPSGAATEAKQDTGNTSLASLDGKITACNTGAVTVSSSVLPTGAATESTLAAASAKLPSALGQAIMAQSLSVAISSNQSTIPVSSFSTGFSIVHIPVRHVYSSNPVTTSAYLNIVPALSAICQEIEIFDSSGETLVLAIGPSGIESNQIFIFPGGNGRVKLKIPAFSAISIKAVSATASVGEICINFYG